MRRLLRFASGGDTVCGRSLDELPCAKGQPQLDPIRRPRQIPPRQLLDLADPVAQRMAMAVQLPRRPLPVAVVLDERLQRAQQLPAVLALRALDRLQEAVAVEAQGVVVLEREQQGEGAEVTVRGDVGGLAVSDRGRLECAAGL